MQRICMDSIECCYSSSLTVVDSCMPFQSHFLVFNAAIGLDVIRLCQSLDRCYLSH